MGKYISIKNGMQLQSQQVKTVSMNQEEVKSRLDVRVGQERSPTKRRAFSNDTLVTAASCMWIPSTDLSGVIDKWLININLLSPFWGPNQIEKS